MAHYQMNFPHLSAVSEFIAATPRRWNQRMSDDHAATDSWDHSCGFNGALMLSRDGWAQGARKLVKGLEHLAPNATVKTRTYAPAGSRPSATRYAVGNPRCMVRPRTDERSKPALTIAVQIGANGNNSADELSNYGLAVASYIETLSKRGYPVEVIACDISTSQGNRLVIQWVVKRMGAPMNYADMAFSIGHPAAFRRLCFAVQERSDCPEMSGYGGAGRATPDDFTGRNVIILNGIEKAYLHSRTPESALEAVSAEIDLAMKERGL